MRLGLAGEGDPPPAQVLDLLERAGLPAGALRAAVGPFEKICLLYTSDAADE